MWLGLDSWSGELPYTMGTGKKRKKKSVLYVRVYLEGFFSILFVDVPVFVFSSGTLLIIVVL